VEDVVGEGAGAEEADGGEDEAEGAALPRLEALAEEEGEAGAEEGAGDGDAGELRERKSDAFHGERRGWGMIAK
jgi:hypothetical protein